MCIAVDPPLVGVVLVTRGGDGASVVSRADLDTVTDAARFACLVAGRTVE